MSSGYVPTKEEILALYKTLNSDAESGGYHLNPDDSFTIALTESLLINKNRYGYMACPCRLASGKRDEDLDIICPCDYRDPDLTEFDACFCALYVSEKVLSGKISVKPVPERRPADKADRKKAAPAEVSDKLSYPVWRCSVCGYLCARKEPPAKCPVCKVDKDRFERFM